MSRRRLHRRRRHARVRLDSGFGFQTVNDASGPAATLLNGVNDLGQLVGFYTNGAGNTIGLVATPKD